MKELINIQSALKAPKNQYNKFGGYNYRNAEDILESVKPLLKENGCVLMLSDEMVDVGGRIYVKSTAILRNSENTEISVSAFAREAESQKGMNEAQLTGSASSYARKYALNGLFCIDDTKDDDFNNTHGKQPVTKNDKDFNLEVAMLEAKEAKDLTALETVWKNWNAYQTNTQFKNLIIKRKKELV